MFSLLNRSRYNQAFRIIQLESRLAKPWMLPQKSTDCGSAKPKHQITYRPYVPRCFSDHDLKNMTLKRPMSPHLAIYVTTMPAATSIFQRITGLILTSYTLLLAGGTLFLGNGVETYVSMIQSLDLSKPLIFLIKVMLGAPFAFHYFNGIRFCAWNAGRWLAMTEVTSSAYKSWIATLAMALLFALL